jgi:hypothetical protein
MTLDKTVVSNVIADNRNSFITVKFLTKSDEERTYNGRMNVQKGLKGNERGRIVAEALRSNGYVTLKTSEGYKCFNLDKVLAIKVNGSEYKETN